MYVPLFRQEIYYYHRIVVYYDAGMFPHDQKQIVRKKPPKEKGQTPMTSVCPFQEKRIVNMAIVALPIQVMIWSFRLWHKVGMKAFHWETPR